MDENVPIEPVEQEAQTPESEQHPEVDKFEVKARELGWRGKDEWEGPEEDFIDAKEFVRRQPLFEKIEHLSKELKRIREGHELLVDHTKKIKDAEFKRAMEQLKAARKTALLEGENEKALAYEEKLEEVEQMRSEFNEQTAQLEQKSAAPVENPVWNNWKSKNGWYGKDKAMTLFADGLGNELASKGMSPAEALEEVAKEVRSEFKHKFVNPNRDKPGSVEAPTRKTPKADAFEMPEEDKKVMNKILRAGGITKEEYLSQYKLINGVK